MSYYYEDTHFSLIPYGECELCVCMNYSADLFLWKATDLIKLANSYIVKPRTLTIISEWNPNDQFICLNELIPAFKDVHTYFITSTQAIQMVRGLAPTFAENLCQFIMYMDEYHARKQEALDIPVFRRRYY